MEENKNSKAISIANKDLERHGVPEPDAINFKNLSLNAVRNLLARIRGNDIALTVIWRLEDVYDENFIKFVQNLKQASDESEHPELMFILFGFESSTLPLGLRDVHSKTTFNVSQTYQDLQNKNKIQLYLDDEQLVIIAKNQDSLQGANLDSSVRVYFYTELDTNHRSEFIKYTTGVGRVIRVVVTEDDVEDTNYLEFIKDMYLNKKKITLNFSPELIRVTYQLVCLGSVSLHTMPRELRKAVYSAHRSRSQGKEFLMYLYKNDQNLMKTYTSIISKGIRTWRRQANVRDNILVLVKSTSQMVQGLQGLAEVRSFDGDRSQWATIMKRSMQIDHTVVIIRQRSDVLESAWHRDMQHIVTERQRLAKIFDIPENQNGVRVYLMESVQRIILGRMRPHFVEVPEKCQEFLMHDGRKLTSRHQEYLDLVQEKMLKT